MYNELFGICIVIFLYWFFNLRNENFMVSLLPMEKMNNLYIFDIL
jgi:hypothetical protein